MSKTYIADPNDHPVASANTEPPEETREELFTNAPELHADKAFADEMKVINRAERKRQEKLAAADRIEQKAAKKAHETEIEAELAKPQSLDPEAVKERIERNARQINENKIYPDPIPYRDEIEERLKERDKDVRANEQPRAKLESVFNDKLHNYLRTAIIIQIVAFCLYASVPLVALTSITGFITAGLISIVSTVAILATIALLELGAKTCKNRAIPYEQRNLFIIATFLPAMLVRTIIALLIVTFSKALPLIGSIAGTLAGYFIGSALQYNYLFKRNIQNEPRMVLYNTLFFIIFQLIGVITALSQLNFSSALAIAGSTTSIYTYLISFVLFLIADGFAAKTSPGTYI